MKTNLIKFFIFINLLTLVGIFFTSTVLAQEVRRFEYSAENYPTRQVVSIPPSTEIVKLSSCYSITLDSSPNFGTEDIPGLRSKLPNGVKMWHEWGIGNSTYQNKTEVKTWTPAEIGDENGKLLPPITKAWTVANLAPDTIYSATLVFEIPAGGERRKPFNTFKYPKFFKTNTGLLCQSEAEELYSKELDSLSSLARFNPTKKIISAFSLKDDPNAIPLSLVPAGTIIYKPVGTCSSGMVMSNSGAWMCPSVINEFNAMIDAARRDGITLRSGAYSGIRMLDMQRDMRKNRNCRNDSETSCPGGRIAAVGASNHTNGDAADFACYQNGKLSLPFEKSPCYTWLVNNASRFGFYNNLPDDRVHWSRTGR